MGAIFNTLGYIESSAPWLCENYTKLYALPEFLIEIVYICYLPNFKNPIFKNG